MTSIQTFEGLMFEPPIEVGERTVSSIGELAALAVHGQDPSSDRQHTFAIRVNDMLASHIAYESAATPCDLLNRTFAAHALPHIVTPTK